MPKATHQKKSARSLQSVHRNGVRMTIVNPRRYIPSPVIDFNESTEYQACMSEDAQLLEINWPKGTTLAQKLKLLTGYLAGALEAKWRESERHGIEEREMRSELGRTAEKLDAALAMVRVLLPAKADDDIPF